MNLLLATGSLLEYPYDDSRTLQQSRPQAQSTDVIALSVVLIIVVELFKYA